MCSLGPIAVVRCGKSVCVGATFLLAVLVFSVCSKVVLFYVFVCTIARVHIVCLCLYVHKDVVVCVFLQLDRKQQNNEHSLQLDLLFKYYVRFFFVFLLILLFFLDISFFVFALSWPSFVHWYERHNNKYVSVIILSLGQFTSRCFCLYNFLRVNSA